MISFECQCGAKVNVDDRLAGKVGRCPRCRRAVRIPGPVTGAQPLSPGVQSQTAGPPPVPNAPLESETAEMSPLEALAEAASQGAPVGQSYDGATPSDALLDLLDSQPASQDAQAPAQPVQSAPHGRLHPKTSLENNSPFIGAGFMILSTIFIPWFVGTASGFFGGESASQITTFMSWDLIKSAPGMLTAFLIIAWYIGLASVVAGFCLRDLPHAICTASHGFVGVLFLLCLWLSLAGTPFMPAGSQAGGTMVVHSLSLILLILLLPVLAIRKELGRTSAIRALQGVFGGALSVLLAVGFILSIAMFTELPQAVRSQLVPDFLVGVLTQMLFLAGAIIALVDAARPKSNSLILIEVARWLICGSLGLGGVYIVIRAAALGRSGGGIALSILNFLILITAPLLLLFLGGVVRVIVEAVSAYRRTHPCVQVQQETTPEEASPEKPQKLSSARRRLQQIQTLYDDGLITKEELADRRAAIVESV